MIFLKKTIAVSICLILILPMSSMAEMLGSSIETSAGHIATDGSTHTGVDRAQNGIPVVNIAQPSGAGVSHNRYQDFNVGGEGAIMNNSNRMDVSILGGALYANPNLDPHGQEARVILNEVTSTRASRLFGATEIHGRTAEYILANPNGITCNGCGFINTPRVLLGTGRPEIQNGDFMGLHMDPYGQVAVEGQGLNAAAQDYFDIVTRMGRINADIHANQLNIKTGGRYYDAKTGEISSVKTFSEGAPSLSLDTSKLGGIYAGRITIESTEMGVGVNTGGKLVSNQDLVLTADGRIEYGSAVSKTGSVTIESQSSGIKQNGYVGADKDLVLKAKGSIILDSQDSELQGEGIYSGGNLKVESQGGAGIENNAKISAAKDVFIETDRRLFNNGMILAGKGAKVEAGSLFNSETGEIQAAGNVDVDVKGSITATGGRIASLKDVNVSAKDDFSNRADIESGGSMHVLAGGELSNEGNLTAGSGESVGDSAVALKIEAGSFRNAGGNLLSHGNAEVSARRNINIEGGSVKAQGDLNFTGGDIANESLIEGNRNLSITAGKNFSNKGTLQANSNLKIKSNSLNNSREGKILSKAVVEMAVDQDASLEGEILADFDVNIEAKGTIQHKGEMQSGRGLNLTAGKLLSNDGIMNAAGGINLRADSLQNGLAGQIVSGEDIEAESEQDVQLNGGLIGAYRDVNLNAKGELANQADLRSGRHLSLTAGKSLSNEGTIVSDGNTVLKGGADVLLRAGQVASRGSLDAAAGLNMANDGDFRAVKTIKMTSGQDLKNDGLIFSGTKKNAGQTEAGIEMEARSISNGSDGEILSYGDAQMSGEQLTLQGLVIAEKDLNLASLTDLTSNSDLQAGEKLVMTAGKSLKNDGSIVAGKAGQNSDFQSLTITADSLINGTEAALKSYGNADFTIKNDADLSGDVTAEGGLNIQTEGNLTQRGYLEAGRNARLTSGKALKNQGVVLSRTNGQDSANGIQITAGSFDNEGDAKLLSFGDVGLEVAGEANLGGGEVIAYRDISVRAKGNLSNKAAVQAERNMSLISEKSLRNEGSVLAGRHDSEGEMLVSAASILNGPGGQFLSYGNLNMNGAQSVNMAAGQAAASKDVTIKSQGNVANNASLHADRKLKVTAAGNFSNQKALSAGDESRLADPSTGIEIKADSLNSGANSTLTSYGNIGLTLNKSVEFNGAMASHGDMNIYSGGDIANRTEIQSNKTLGISAGGILTNHSLLAGGSSATAGDNGRGIALSAGELNNLGSLLSYGKADVSVRENLDLTGRIMTYGNLSVIGNKNITNKTNLDVGGSLSINAGEDFSNGYLSGDKSILHHIASNLNTDIRARKINNYGSIQSGGKLSLSAQDSLLNDRRVSDQGFQGSALLMSGGDMALQANSITNHAGEILSMSNLALTADTLDNRSDELGSNYSAAVIEANNDVSIQAKKLNNVGFDYDLDPSGYCGYTTVIVETGPGGINGWGQIYREDAYSTLKTKPSFITAGRDMTITGADIWNWSASISSWRDLVITGGHLRNEQSGFNVNLRRWSGFNHFWGDCNAFGGDCSNKHIRYEREDASEPFTIVSDFAPNVFAARSLYVNNAKQIWNGNSAALANKIRNTARLDSIRQTGSLQTLDVLIPQVQITEAPSQIISKEISLENNFAHAAIAVSAPQAISTAFIAKTPVSLTESSLVNLSSLFALSHNPESRFVVETRGNFLSLDGLKGSQYFLDRIGYNPRADVKLLGDDYFQAKLIERSLRETTGRLFLEKGAGNSMEQIEGLYANAYEAFQDLKLSPGIALSSDQIAQLRKDIVWLVETEIDVEGKTQKVLVPQIYLAQATRDSLLNSEETIAGETVAMRSEDDLVNTGSVLAEKRMEIASDANILNTAGRIQSQGNLSVSAGKNIMNRAATIAAGNDLSLKAKGDIISESVKVREGDGDNWSERISGHASIESGGNTVLEAGKDIRLLASSLKAGKDLALDAKENVSIEAEQLHYQRHATDHSTWDYKEGGIKNVFASVESGGNMHIRSGNDTHIIGANVKSSGDMGLETAGALTVASVQDSKYSNFSKVEKDWRTTEETVKNSAKLTQKSSNLSAGGNFTSVSGGDTNIIASNVSAAGDGTMIAGSQIEDDGTVTTNKSAQLNILSAADMDYDFSYHKKTQKFDPAAMALGSMVGMITGGPMGSLAGLQTGAKAERGKITENESYHTHEAGSNLKIGGDLTLASAGNINIISSKVNSNRNLAALAGQELRSDRSLEKVNDDAALLIGAKEEIHQDRRVVKEIKPDYAGVAAGAAVSGFLTGLTGGAGGALLGSMANGTAGLVLANAGYVAAGLGASQITSMGSGMVASKMGKSASETVETKLRSSDVSSGQSMELSGEKKLTVSASRLRASGDIFLESQGDVNIAYGEEKLNRKETHDETGFGGFSMAANRSSLDLNWTQKGEEKEKNTSRVTAKQSELAAGGGINIRSRRDTNIASSNLYAGGKVAIDAGNDVNLTTAKEIETITEKESSYKNTFTQSVGNSWIETGFAAHDAVKTAKDLADSDSNAPMKEINVAVSAGKAAVQAYQVAKTIKSVAGSAATAGTFGFYSDFSMTQEKETKSSSQEKMNEVGSRLQSTDMEIEARHNLLAKGVDLVADGGDLALKAGHQVRVESSESAVGTSSSQEKQSLKVILASTRGDYLPSLSVSRSEQSSSQITQNNSNIQATHGQVKIESGANTELMGVNVRAQKVDMTGIGGNLTLASKQAREESKSSEYSLTLGGEKVGFSIGQSQSDERWTRSQSSIIGTGSVDIKAKELNLEGAMIANERSDGKDGENLNISVDRLNHKDLQDTSESSRWKYGLGVGLSKSGSTDVSAAFSGHDKEGLTLATIGEGNIIVKDHPDETAHINRDISTTQIVTKDEVTGGLDIDVSISNKLISDIYNEGLIDTAENEIGKIKDTLKDLPDDLEKAGTRLKKAGDDLTESVALGINGPAGITGIWQQNKLRIADNEALVQLTPRQRDIMKNAENYSEPEKLAALNRYNEVFAGVLGVDPAQASFFSANLIDETRATAKIGSQEEIDKRDLIGGTDADPDKKDIYYEADRTNDGDNLARAAGHEGSRYLNAQKGIVNDSSPDGKSGPQDELAKKMGQHSVDSLDHEIALQRDANDGTFSIERHVRDQADQNLIMAGTKKIEEAERVEAFLQAMVAGAIIGGLTDYVTQGLINHYGEKKLSFRDSFSSANIDGKSVKIAAGLGATGSGLAAGFGRLGTALKLGKTATVIFKETSDVAVDTVINAADQKLRTGHVDMKSAISDAVKNKVGEHALKPPKIDLESSAVKKLSVSERKIGKVAQTTDKISTDAPASKKLYRYVNEKEAKVIRKTGEIPIRNSEDKIRDIYLTDKEYITAGRAKTHLQMPNKPTYRIEINPENVDSMTAMTKIKSRDNPQWGMGGGTEAKTSSSIRVDPKKLERLKGAE